MGSPLRRLNIDLARGTEHENTVTEGSIAGYDFPANFWTTGKVVEFVGSLTVVDSNSTDTLLLAVRFGASTTVTSNTSLAAGAAVDVADADIATVRGTLVCRSAGSAGSFFCSINQSDADAAGVAVKAYAAVASSIDTTAATYLDWTGDWSVAHADNEVASDLWNVYEIVD